jgi:hypothetical protein
MNYVLTRDQIIFKSWQKITSLTLLKKKYGSFSSTITTLPLPKKMDSQFRELGVPFMIRQ